MALTANDQLTGDFDIEYKLTESVLRSSTGSIIHIQVNRLPIHRASVFSSDRISTNSRTYSEKRKNLK